MSDSIIHLVYKTCGHRVGGREPRDYAQALREGCPVCGVRSKVITYEIKEAGAER